MQVMTHLLLPWMPVDRASRSLVLLVSWQRRARGYEAREGGGGVLEGGNVREVATWRGARGERRGRARRRGRWWREKGGARARRGIERAPGKRQRVAEVAATLRATLRDVQPTVRLRFFAKA